MSGEETASPNKPQSPAERAKEQRRLKRYVSKRILPTPLAKKKYGDHEVRVAADGTSYLVLPNGQWIRVINEEIENDNKEKGLAFLVR